MGTSRLKVGAVDYSSVLESIFELMLSSGLPCEDVLTACKRSVKRAETRSKSRRLRETGGLVSAALVLDAWHRDRRYLTPQGLPKAVRLLGRTPSVEALIRAHTGHRNASETAERLKNLHLLVPCGRGLYRPTSDAAVISDREPIVLQHAARALSTLVETVGRNVHPGSSLAPLLERVAEIPDLPRRHIADFQRFTHLQGRTFLRTVNDWLEARRARRNRRGTLGTTVRAGIHAYAYVAAARGRASAGSQ
jgi:hypothetical protein